MVKCVNLAKVGIWFWRGVARRTFDNIEVVGGGVGVDEDPRQGTREEEKSDHGGCFAGI